MINGKDDFKYTWAYLSNGDPTSKEGMTGNMEGVSHNAHCLNELHALHH